MIPFPQSPRKWSSVRQGVPLVPFPLPATADSRGGEGAAQNRNARCARGFSRVTSGVWGQTRRNQQPKTSDLPDTAVDSPERLRLLRGGCPVHIAAFLFGRTCYPKSLAPASVAAPTPPPFPPSQKCHSSAAFGCFQSLRAIARS